VSYDPRVLRVSGVDLGDAFDTFSSAIGVNEEEGLVYLCAYRPDAVTVRGRGPTVVFDLVDYRGELPNWALDLEGFYLNDQLSVQTPLSLVAVHELPGGFIGGGINPNPFNPETSIGFYLPQGEARYTALKVYNLQGQLVRTLVAEVLDSGEHVVQWNGKNEAGVEVASGVFFAVLESGDIHQTRKLMLLK
jgi:hypothetical protein